MPTGRSTETPRGRGSPSRRTSCLAKRSPRFWFRPFKTRSAFMSIPRALLHDCLLDGAGAPLEPSLRTIMETRFGAGFGDVRIHTGAAAGALCEALRARAVTLSRDIVFGDAQYAPASPAGQRLLAHELVHVMQQRAAITRPTSRLVVLGDKVDACESEADRLAEEALGAGLRSAVTPDATGAIRRAIRVTDATAVITTSHSGAAPGVSITKRGPVDMAVLHLTRNSGSIVKGAVRSAAAASAIRMTGSVMVDADPGENILNNISFHFIQLFSDIKSIAFYAGQTSADGSMSLDFVGPKYFKGYRRFLLDSEPSFHNSPYSEAGKAMFNLLNRYSNLWLVTLNADDHPFEDYPIQLHNPAAGNKLNYLYKVGREFQVITTFVANDLKTFKRSLLTHVKWGATCEASFRWSPGQGDSNVLSLPAVTGTFTVDPASTKGPPTAPGLKDMILNANMNDPDMYNSAAKDASASVLGGTTSDLDIDLRKGWSPMVPAEHFKPL
jgi:Domain of unknown function (DUF4157)